MNDVQKRIRILMADDHPMFREGLRSMLAADDHFTIVGEASNGSEAVTLARQTLPDILLLDVAMPLMSGFEVLQNISNLDKGVRPIMLTANITRNEIVYALQLGARGILWKNSAVCLLLKSIQCVMNEQLWISREITSDLVNVLRALPTVQCGKLQDLSKQPKCEETVPLSAPRSPKAKPSEQPDEAVSAGSSDERKFGLTAREVEIVSAIVDGQSNRDIALTYGISEYTVKHHLTSIFDKVGVYSRLELAVFAIHHELGSHLNNFGHHV
jgi:two-component system nitrate/nitrite response regulator NarL